MSRQRASPAPRGNPLLHVANLAYGMCGPLPAHSMGYIKGQSRGLTLLALLHVVFQDGFLDLATYLPAFYHSVLVVFGQVMAPMSVPDQVVLNFALNVK